MIASPEIKTSPETSSVNRIASSLPENNHPPKPKRAAYCLDTNVILHAAESLDVFEENTIWITETVLAELDTFKKGNLDVNLNARAAVRRLRELREQAHANKTGSVLEGLPTAGGGKIKFLPDDPKMPSHIKGDDRIIQTILATIEREKIDKDSVTVVSKDGVMQFKCEIKGLASEDYKHDKASSVPSRLPVTVLKRSHLDLIARTTAWRESGEVQIPGFFKKYRDIATSKPISPGYIIFKTSKNDAKDYLALVDETGTLTLIMENQVICKKGSNAIKPRNIEQRAAVHALIQEDKSLILLLGKAGTGKTLLATAVAIELASKSRKHAFANPAFPGRNGNGSNGNGHNHPNSNGHTQTEEEDPNEIKVVISRPMVSVGQDMGFLPGSADEKLMPWMEPVKDQLEIILGEHEAQNRLKDGFIKLQPIPIIRGRSLHNRILIIDEAQNLTPLEVKTIITRAGQRCKVVLCGDVTQIDHPYLDTTTNGLSYVAQNMGHLPMVAVVPLEKRERSELSEAAATYL